MKQQRHSAIRELLVNTVVTNQDELRRKLAGHGFHVTQATLSRDIHELRLMKGPAGYKLPNNSANSEDEGPGIREVLRSFGLEVRLASNLLVLITTTGSAPAPSLPALITKTGPRSSAPSPATTPYSSSAPTKSRPAR